MADSKSAGRRAVRVRVPLRVQGGSLPGFGGPLPAYLSLLWWRESGPDLSVVNAPFGVAVANSLQALRRLWVGWHVLFHVCGWCHRLWGLRLWAWLV